jgi:hypothetical protein
LFDAKCFLIKSTSKQVLSLSPWKYALLLNGLIRRRVNLKIEISLLVESGSEHVGWDLLEPPMASPLGQQKHKKWSYWNIPKFVAVIIN